MFNLVDDYGNDAYYFDTVEIWQQVVVSMSAYGGECSWVWTSETVDV